MPLQPRARLAAGASKRFEADGVAIVATRLACHASSAVTTFAVLEAS
jgi:hypothetical protein